MRPRTRTENQEIVHKLFRVLHSILDSEEEVTLTLGDEMLANSTNALLGRADAAISVVAAKLAGGGTGTGPTTEEVDAALTPRVQALEALAGTPAPNSGA